VDINSAVGRKNRLTRDEIATILDGGFEGFPPAEQALLRLADGQSATPANVSDELFAELRQHFSEEQLIEMAANVAQENYRARLNRAFDVKSQGFYHMPTGISDRHTAA
jgi:alkylhydroperoxidase family enzyme